MFKRSNQQSIHGLAGVIATHKQKDHSPEAEHCAVGKENQARESVNQSHHHSVCNYRKQPEIKLLVATQQTIIAWAKARTEKFTESKHFKAHSSALILNMGQEHLACCRIFA